MPTNDIPALSDVYKFTHSLGQRGHQIGRKVGDAIEILTLGVLMADRNCEPHLKIEAGVEGATSAHHKVEFAYYQTSQNGRPNFEDTTSLFGIVECKKVGVEVTQKQSFKKWKKTLGGQAFHQTDGFQFSVNPGWSAEKRTVFITSEDGIPTLCVVVSDSAGTVSTETIPVDVEDRVTFALDVTDSFHVVRPDQGLADIASPIGSCSILTVTAVSPEGVSEINVEDCLRGPQTPEKAKQASFVSLDVRKKTIGTFDKPVPADPRFTSVLVIGEGSHWESKSRSMVRLCNDHNLIMPDKVVVDFFEACRSRFGDGYQDQIRKNHYLENADMRDCVASVLESHGSRVLMDMDTGLHVVPRIEYDSDVANLAVREA